MVCLNFILFFVFGFEWWLVSECYAWVMRCCSYERVWDSVDNRHRRVIRRVEWFECNCQFWKILCCDFTFVSFVLFSVQIKVTNIPYNTHLNITLLSSSEQKFWTAPSWYRIIPAVQWNMSVLFDFERTLTSRLVLSALTSSSISTSGACASFGSSGMAPAARTIESALTVIPKKVGMVFEWGFCLRREKGRVVDLCCGVASQPVEAQAQTLAYEPFRQYTVSFFRRVQCFPNLMSRIQHNSSKMFNYRCHFTSETKILGGKGCLIWIYTLTISLKDKSTRHLPLTKGRGRSSREYTQWLQSHSPELEFVAEKRPISENDIVTRIVTRVVAKMWLLLTGTTGGSGMTGCAKSQYRGGFLLLSSILWHAERTSFLKKQLILLTCIVREVPFYARHRLRRTSSARG